MHSEKFSTQSSVFRSASSISMWTRLKWYVKSKTVFMWKATAGEAEKKIRNLLCVYIALHMYVWLRLIIAPSDWIMFENSKIHFFTRQRIRERVWACDLAVPLYINCVRSTQAKRTLPKSVVYKSEWRRSFGAVLAMKCNRERHKKGENWENDRTTSAKNWFQQHITNRPPK